jgi:hypothetical protein
MKSFSLFICMFCAMYQLSFSQTNSKPSKRTQIKNEKLLNEYPSFNQSLLLETKSDTTANISFGDFNLDGNPDILLVKGRHWPIVDRVLLGDGLGGIQKTYDLGSVSDRSYTGGLADFNSDGFPDIAISNDAPDRKLIYLNDGKGNFTIGSEFGRPGWPTRNLSIADMNLDGSPDLILANRGNSRTSNYICLNQGKGQFNANCIAIARYPATTITPADLNHDGYIDLVIPHRNGGQSFIYLGNKNMDYSDSFRIPFGPPDATIRGAAVADFTGDGIPDIVTIDENKGVSLYTGQKNLVFEMNILLADSKIIPYALAIADLNKDKRPDIIVGHIKAPSTAFYNEGTGKSFKSISFGDSKGTVYGFAIGDFNKDGIYDIAAARSDATNILYFGSVNSK